ncbi:Serpentine Receptor, class BC (Class B-like) [Caenorhabditis elegans]|uniref:Serpentine Receptor, class BC (Class B-like) n=1 Tax=Caenorhabditis elegans TaxID=6239 RepID=A0A131MBX3_CAEEL|nr:Serpentine Receptor, class BC (Class B-like) [Caenorhabditis elegans]CZR14584.1 Serpentine Receptor, class BC (Class B-like) [Caenorhabditis elegans]|eukprot:NP_001309659.1 Serpentine Receptor, class BC (class B-like) [Caenorhabditis elegans]
MTAFLIPSILTTIVICQINIFLNSSLLFTIFCLKGITSKSDMSLVYSRFAADIGYSCSIIVFKLYVLAGMISKTFILKNIIFFVIRATVILGIIRTSLLFIISLDRIIALFSSQFYNPNRRKLPLSVIFLIISSSIAFDHFIMFGYCENVIDTPIDCDSARCCYNACYAHFWISREQVMFCCIVMMTVLLSLKLVVCTYFTHNQHARILSRAVRYSTTLPFYDDFFLNKKKPTKNCIVFLSMTIEEQNEFFVD